MCVLIHIRCKYTCAHLASVLQLAQLAHRPRVHRGVERGRQRHRGHHVLHRWGPHGRARALAPPWRRARDVVGGAPRPRSHARPGLPQCAARSAWRDAKLSYQSSYTVAARRWSSPPIAASLMCLHEQLRRGRVTAAETLKQTWLMPVVLTAIESTFGPKHYTAQHIQKQRERTPAATIRVPAPAPPPTCPAAPLAPSLQSPHWPSTSQNRRTAPDRPALPPSPVCTSARAIGGPRSRRGASAIGSAPQSPKAIAPTEAERNTPQCHQAAGCAEKTKRTNCGSRRRTERGGMPEGCFS